MEKNGSLTAKARKTREKRRRTAPRRQARWDGQGIRQSEKAAPSAGRSELGWAADAEQGKRRGGARRQNSQANFSLELIIARPQDGRSPSKTNGKLRAARRVPRRLRFFVRLPTASLWRQTSQAPHRGLSRTSLAHL
jgi:hypothetical protein